jgi:hypothetical protein
LELQVAAEKAEKEKLAQESKASPLLLAALRSPRPEVEFIRPMSDENARLVHQGGLFTRAPEGVDLETWTRRQFKDEKGSP